MISLVGVVVERKMYESANYLVYRGINQQDGTPVMFKVLKESSFTPLGTVSELIPENVQHNIPPVVSEVVLETTQALLGELELDHLLNNLINLLLEHTDTQTAYVILPCRSEPENEMTWAIEAVGHSRSVDDTEPDGTTFESVPQANILQSLPLGDRVPASILNHVIRTHEPLVLDDAMYGGDFANDVYIQRHQIKSLICIPLLHCDRCVGIIYLENNLITEAFTQNQFNVLKYIAKQAALAIHNADRHTRLRIKLEAQIAEQADALRRGEVINRAIFNAFPDLIIRMHRDGTYLEIKPATTFPTAVEPTCIGRNVQDILPPEIAQQRLASAEAALKTGTIQIYEFPFNINGQFLWQEARIVPLNVNEVLVVIRDLTERKDVEAFLRDSEQFLRTIYEGIEAAVFIVDVLEDGNFRYVGINPTHERMSGLLSSALSGKTPEQVLVPEMAKAVSDRYRQCIAAGERITYEEYLVMNGNETWWITNLTPLRNRNSKIYRLIGTSFNINDRKQAEEALRQNEQLLQFVLQNMPVMLDAFDADGNVILWNQECERVTGYRAEEIIGNPRAMYLLYPEPSYLEQRMLEWAERGNHYRNWEWDLTCKDGSIKTIAWSNISAELPVPKWASWGIGVDVTQQNAALRERKRTEEALRESEERFRRAFNDAAIGMGMVAIDGQFLRVNHALCEILGYSETEFLSFTFHDITLAEDLQNDINNRQRLLSGETRIYQTEKRYIHKQGYAVWTLVNASLIRDHNQNPLYFITQIQDISDRHQINRMKDEFISIVSHELRTPLTAIRGSLGILESGVLDNEPEQVKEMLQIALNNSDRLVRLVNIILDLERLESGKIQLVMEQSDAIHLAQQAIEAVQSIANDANITLSVTVPATQIWAAPDAIVQTLTNLLSNAIKFSPSGSRVWLRAELGAREVPGSNAPPLAASPYVIFSIKDFGRGIPPEKLETIFERFQQVDASDSRQKGGTGLGLAICKSIVQQHGGTIWAESVLGEGSTFYFTLPLMKTDKQ